MHDIVRNTGRFVIFVDKMMHEELRGWHSAGAVLQVLLIGVRVWRSSEFSSSFTTSMTSQTNTLTLQHDTH